MREKVLVLGGNFGGLTAALAVQRELHGDVDVTVVSASDRFLFNPSLIWLPFGRRTPAEITFPLAPTFERHGVELVHGSATEIDPRGRKVTTTAGTYDYDHLVIATGYRNDLSVVPGLAEGNATTITTLDDAVEARRRWHRFIDDPGDVVIGATQGAGCFGAAYEFLVNTSHQLRRHGLAGQVELTYVTAEPFVGHFGIGGLPGGERLLRMFLKREGIDVITDVAMESVDEGRVTLADGRHLDNRFAMIIPPFKGQHVVAEAEGLADAGGYVPVRRTYQAEGFDDVYAVGVAAAVDVPWATAVPVGIPKTGFPTERMAHVAARNIAATIRGGEPTEETSFAEIPAVCVMDAGDNGVAILADRMLPPRRFGVMIPGPQSHAMKVAFERYFLWKARKGYVNLP